RTNRPAFLYVFLIDTRGNVTIVHPWVETFSPLSADPSMRVLSTKQSRSIALSLPADQTWILADGPRGVETFLLLASDSPISPQVDFRSILTNLEPQIGDPGDE